ncbi:MAG: beta/gamma crystallin-related protein [Limnohabitans sp.]
MSFKRTLIQTSALAALTVSTLASAQITFYEHEDFRGSSFVTSSWINNFNRYGFNDRASSVIITSGRWEVCEDVRYRGRCVLLQPGYYDSLRAMGMNDRISSVRPVESAYEPPIPVPAPEVQGYEYQRRPHERLLEVPVTSARAVVGPPEQRCWMDREQVSSAQPNVGGAIAGALIGGIIGHQIGGGTGRDLMTGGGALAGGVIGSRMGNDNAATTTREVRRCETTVNTTPAYWDVTYIFRGQPHHVQMRNDPGPTITVNDNGEPRQ